MKSVSDGVVEKIRTNVMCNSDFYNNGAFQGIMWKNILGPGRPKMTMWPMHIACWIPNATDTHTQNI